MELTTSVLMKVALETKFKGANLDFLMDVANATPNAEMAIIVLLGLYKEPAIAPVRYNNDGLPCTFTSYNKWKDFVSYERPIHKTMTIRVAKDQDKNVININNYQQFVIENGTYENSTWCYVELPEMTTTSDDTSLKTWNEWSKNDAAKLDADRIEKDAYWVKQSKRVASNA